jgi:hypothetical protein
MRNRQKIRIGQKVIHRHEAAGRTFRRVSELVFIKGVPKAILGWVDIGGMRTPVYLCDLDPAKLTQASAPKKTWYYSGTTVDPRYENVEPARPKEPMRANR